MEGRRFADMERKYVAQRAYNVRRAKMTASAAIAREPLGTE
jgi:hypothetical protein